MDRQTDTLIDRHTHTDMLITILYHRSRGQSKNKSRNGTTLRDEHISTVKRESSPFADQLEVTL